MSDKNATPIRVGWRSPSNIALVKYWGKHGRQLPANPSISFTLSRAYTETFVEFVPGREAGSPILDDFKFEDKPQPDFARRLEQFLSNITPELPFLNDYKLRISSSNSFPHSSGIASSASAMSALALCLVEGSCLVQGAPFDLEQKRQMVSEIARLGSGSASRSVIPRIGIWGYHPEVEGSSDRYAVGLSQRVHPEFDDWRDDIVLVSDAVKSVSSSMGHQLMNRHPFAEVRYRQARKNLTAILGTFQTGDVEEFGRIVEEEALTLHGLMMNSNPSYTLMLPETLRIIRDLRAWRAATRVPLYFTLDAGPNVHLLYPATYQAQVEDWYTEALGEYLASGRMLRDQIGPGPSPLEV